MAENQSITASEGNKPEAPPTEGITPVCEVCGDLMAEARSGKKTCWPCERQEQREEEKAAARQKLIDKNTKTDYLDARFSKALDPFNSLCAILDDAEYETVHVLNPLVEHLRAELQKIEAVIATTLGHLEILVCTNSMNIDGKTYYRGDFYEALLGPKEARDRIC